MIGSQKNAATRSAPIVVDCVCQRVDASPTAHGAVSPTSGPDTDLNTSRADDARAVAGEPVVAALTCQDRRALRLVGEAPEAPGQLHGCLDGLAAAAREEDDGVLDRRQLADALGEARVVCRRDVAVVRVGVQRLHLGRGGGDDLAPPVADVRVPEPGRRVDVPAPVRVPDVRSLTALEPELTARSNGVHVRHGVPEARAHLRQPSRVRVDHTPCN